MHGKYNRAGPCINPLRSTRCVAKTFKLDARLDPGAVLQKLTGVNLRLGLVWMPSPQIVLSNEAGAVLRECMLSHRRFFREDGLGQAVFKVSLLVLGIPDSPGGKIHHLERRCWPGRDQSRQLFLCIYIDI